MDREGRQLGEVQPSPGSLHGADGVHTSDISILAQMVQALVEDRRQRDADAAEERRQREAQLAKELRRQEQERKEHEAEMRQQIDILHRLVAEREVLSQAVSHY